MNTGTCNLWAGRTACWLARRAPRGWWAGAVCAGVLLVASVVTCRGEEAATPPAPDQAGMPGTVQKTCPVLANNDIRPDIYVDYQGKRVYFCCQMCRSAFIDHPERYLDRLPQFAAVAPAGGQQQKARQGEGESLAASLAVPTGILTLSLVAAAVLLAVLRRLRGLNVRLMLQLHKTVGFCALASGLVHATIVALL